MERVGGNILKFNFFSCLYPIIIKLPLNSQQRLRQGRCVLRIHNVLLLRMPRRGLRPAGKKEFNHKDTKTLRKMLRIFLLQSFVPLCLCGKLVPGKKAQALYFLRGWS